MTAGRTPSGRARVRWCLVAIAALAVTSGLSPDASAGDLRGVSRWITVGGIGGATQLDAALQDYRWQTGARPTWGVQALAGQGRWSAGLRAWQAWTTQSTGIPGETAIPEVRLASIGAVGRVRLAAVGGVELMAIASAGRLHLGWHPDRATYDLAGVGEPVVIHYEPVDTWLWGAGMAFRRSIGRRLLAGASMEHLRFDLETAHRAGDAIAVQRETFGNWSLRLELSWIVRQS